MPHQGEILQEAIKNSGVSITRIVETLGITRPTIYRKFKEYKVDYSFAKRIGEIIGHDFAQDFIVAPQPASLPAAPAANSIVATPVTSVVTAAQSPDTDIAKQLAALQTKYISLLEAYNDLLLKVYGPR